MDDSYSYVSYFKDRTLAFILDYFFAILCVFFAQQFLFNILLGVLVLEESRAELISVVITSIIVPIAYFTLFEGFAGTTPGKKFYTLVVIHENEAQWEEESDKILLIQAFIRSLPKIRIELVLLDLIIGNILKFPSLQRLSDRLSKTVVIKGPDPQLARGEQKTMIAFRRIFTLIALFFVSIGLINFYVGIF